MKINIDNEKELKRLFDHSTLEACRSVLAHLNKQNIGVFHTTREAMYTALISATEFKPFTILVDEFYCNGIIEYKAPEPVIIEVPAPRPNYNRLQELIIKIFRLEK